MVKPKTPNNSGELKKYTELRPVSNNATRWMSVMDMLERYIRIKQHLEKIPAILSCLHAPAEDARVKELCEFLKPDKSVTLALQK